MTRLGEAIGGRFQFIEETTEAAVSRMIDTLFDHGVDPAEELAAIIVLQGAGYLGNEIDALLDQALDGLRARKREFAIPGA